MVDGFCPNKCSIHDSFTHSFYWGGNKSYSDMIRDGGNIVFELSVGPVSSNWDRAIEAYYQLKGGQVDYGNSHSKKYNLEQTIQKWIHSNLKGRFYVGKGLHIDQTNKISESLRIGFEEPKELSYFTLACPHLKY